MPNKYIPPQLRNEDGSLKQQQRKQSNYNQENTRGGSYARNNNQSYGGRGNYRNQDGGYRRNQGSYRADGGQRQNYNSYSNTRGGSYGGYGGGNYEQQPPEVVSYVELQKSKGIDCFLKQKELETKKTQGTANSSQSRFASWDSRSNSSSSGTKSPLGFNGYVQLDEEKEKAIFSQTSNTGINFDKYDSIPVEVSGDNAPGPLESFISEEAKSMLSSRLLDNLKLCGFQKPTPVQKHSIPIGLAERDLMACAQTGSGKTGGFLFPVISLLLRNGAKVVKGGGGGYGRNRVARPNALVMGPTRELVLQIFEEAEKFCYGTGLRAVACYGGAPSREQSYNLRSGCDILMATPGRLLDFIDQGVIELCCVQQLVLDEADKMLDMGFEPTIRQIVNEKDLPMGKRTFMFSATFPKEIQKLAAEFMEDYIFLTVGRVGSAATDITQTLEFVSEREKLDKLVSVLNGIERGLVLVFVQTKRGAEDLQFRLYDQGFPTSSIHGDRTQHEREEALRSFKAAETPILVATDVAARGLDIDNVTFVINYDLPGNIDDYVHRIGRTGRAGNKGTALSFFTERNSNIAAKLVSILKESSQEIPSFLTTYANGGRGGYRGTGGNRDYRRGGQGQRRTNNSGGWGGNSGGGGQRGNYAGSGGGYQGNNGGYSGNNNRGGARGYAANRGGGSSYTGGDGVADGWS